MFSRAIRKYPLLKGYAIGSGPWPTEPLRDFAALLHDLGFQGIDFSEGWMLSADSILEALEGTGILVSNLGGGVQMQNPDANARARGLQIDRTSLELAKAIGCPTVGEHYIPFRETLSVQDQPIIDQLRDLAPDVKRTGVGILLEPMVNRKDPDAIDLQQHAVRILEAVGEPGFRVVTDFWHFAMEKVDITECLHRNGKYTGAVHLSEGPKRTEPGSTGFDYRPGFRELKRWGYSGWLTLECIPSDNSVEASLGRGLEYVKQQWSEA